MITTAEWNKFMSWLLAMFPAWKPDKAVSAAWKEQLESFSREALQAAVKAVMSAAPSPYPPGVFQLLAAASRLRDEERVRHQRLFTSAAAPVEETQEQRAEMLKMIRHTRMLLEQGDYSKMKSYSHHD